MRVASIATFTALAVVAGFLLFVVALGSPTPTEPVHAAAAMDYFLKIDDIEGESTDKSHKGEIDVLSWSWGMSQSGVREDGIRGLTDFQELALTKYVDKSTPDLMLKVANGKHIEHAELIVRKAGGDGQQSEYFIIKMERVIVTSVSTGGNGGEDRLTENVTLNFGAVKVEYTPQDSKGTEGPEVFDWDIVANEQRS